MIKIGIHHAQVWMASDLADLFNLACKQVSSEGTERVFSIVARTEFIFY